MRFTARTATRIEEASGARTKNINRTTWMRDLCRQTTPGPVLLLNKGNKGKRRRTALLIPEIRPLPEQRPTRR
ncbi:hypothetical protein KNE206_05090 [Kitasatospora sp. NE20-6]|uniref:hypothetical protein n=1 Tax=Kitasatospora sp. NE20-6 TaxID=2859066 RepID=UPI0034DC229E